MKAPGASARGMTVMKAELPSAMNPDLAGMIAVTGMAADPSWGRKIGEATFVGPAAPSK